jgi:hypothetical protein
MSRLVALCREYLAGEMDVGTFRIRFIAELTRIPDNRLHELAEMVTTARPH